VSAAPAYEAPNGDAGRASDSREGDILELTRAYEQALSSAVSESDGALAAQAFDRADRLQQRLLRATQRKDRRIS
jgi:hypothetical protein